MRYITSLLTLTFDKKLSYRGETARQDVLRSKIGLHVYFVYLK